MNNMIDIYYLNFICKQSQNNLRKYLCKKLKEFYDKDIVSTNDYIYVKGELPICLVAHLDTVHSELPQQVYHDLNLNTLHSPQGIGGDDRCGVYIILKLLEQGFRPSIIFCTDEEIGGIGATAFTKDYQEIENVNWFLEFDRKGKNDVVRYDDDNGELTNEIVKFGFKEEWGTFSDISILAPHFGKSAVNLSSGYYLAHTLNEYINLDDLEEIIDKATKILSSDLVNKKFKYIETDYTNWYTSRYDYYTTRYDYYPTTNNYDYTTRYDYPQSTKKNYCELCDKEVEEVYDTEFGLMCEDCIKFWAMKKCECGLYVDNSTQICPKCGQPVEDDIC